YEVSGNASGKLNIVYYNAQGSATTLTNVSLPWSKEITVENSAAYAGFTISAAGGGAGTAGQSVTAKLYAGGVVKKSQTATVDNNGYVQIGPLMHYF
ncbi:hypothetical protein EOE65_17940, partial [Neptunomonas marina]